MPPPTVNDTPLGLGAPLFLFALIILHARVGLLPHRTIVPPFSSAVEWTSWKSMDCQGDVARDRRRLARAAMQVVARIFVSCNMASPAGICIDARPQSARPQGTSWLNWLSRLNPLDAVHILGTNVLLVPAAVYDGVEQRYNTAIRTLSQKISHPCIPCLALTPGSLRFRISELAGPYNPEINDIACPLWPVPEGGGFYHVSLEHEGRKKQTSGSLPLFQLNQYSTVRMQFVAFWCQMDSVSVRPMGPPEPLCSLRHTRMFRSQCQIIKELRPLGIDPVELQRYLTHRPDLRPFRLLAMDMWGNMYLGPELKIMQWMAEPRTQPQADAV